MARQEDMYSCSIRNACIRVHQHHMHSCPTRTRVLFDRSTCILVEQQQMYSFPTRKHAFLFNNSTGTLLDQEYMYSCSTRGHVFSFNKTTCTLIQQGHMYSCPNRIHAFLFNKNTCILEYMSSHSTSIHVLLVVLMSYSLWKACLTLTKQPVLVGNPCPTRIHVILFSKNTCIPAYTCSRSKGHMHHWLFLLLFYL